jgi:hypothetical protein
VVRFAPTTFRIISNSDFEFSYATESSEGANSPANAGYNGTWSASFIRVIHTHGSTPLGTEKEIQRFVRRGLWFEHLFRASDFINLALELRELKRVNWAEVGFTAAIIVSDSFGFAIHCDRGCSPALINYFTRAAIGRFAVGMVERKIIDAIDLRDKRGNFVD